MADTDEKLVGTDGDDTIDAGEGNDYILGDAGDDTLTGGTGRDHVRGGSGDDVIYGGAGIDILRGDSGDDEIYGGAGRDTILGDAGDDTIDGGAGNDTIFGGSGDDTLTGGAGADTFVYTGVSGDDTITDFSLDVDTLDLRLIQQTITFSDLTIEQDGSDTKITISHDDLDDDVTITLEGITATDLTADHFEMPNPPTTSITTETNHKVQLGENPWEGSNYHDIMIDGADDTQILGKSGNDTIFAGEGDDELYGGTGSDILMGEEGDDTIDGGADDDTMWGGSGDDTFVFQAGHGNDTIKDFEDGNDTIDLTAFTAVTGFSDLTITQDGDNTKIDLSSQGGGEITIEDFTSTDLSAADFDFSM